MKTPQEAKDLLYARFRVRPKLSDAVEIYNHLTGNDGEDKNDYGDVVITAVPINFMVFCVFIFKALEINFDDIFYFLKIK